MKQLELTNDELVSIGFELCISKGDEMNTPREFFKIETLNSYFYYNPNQEIHKWYHKTIIGDNANNINLDITQRPVLFSILSAFKADFNIVM
tara:strand:+ start:274 stop:549 length:276 start_codon:yes stop_codon:yes gene_type:complete